MKKRLLILFLSISLYGFSQDSWKTVDGDKYYLLMPGNPDTSTIKKYAAGYGSYMVHIKMFIQANDSDDQNDTYGLSVTEYPVSFGITSDDSTEYIDNGFDGEISLLVKTLQGTTPSGFKNISINGFPGREYEVEMKSMNALVTIRMFLVNNRLYSLLVGTLKENAGNSNICKFLDSFTLKP